MEILVSVVLGVIRMFLPAIFRAARPTAEDGVGPGDTENRLRAQLRKEGWL